MPSNKKSDSAEIFKGVLLIHLILIFHLVFIALLGLTVIFLGGISRYIVWILLGGILLALLSGYIFYRYLKSKGKKALHDLENSSIVKNRSVEIRFLGGMASLKLGNPSDAAALEGDSVNQRLQLEDPRTIHIRDLGDLARMYEKNLISHEEFTQAKKKILNPPS